MNYWVVVPVTMLSLWVLFNLLAPFSVLVKATPISPGRLPRELLTSRAARRVRFYFAELSGGYGYSLWAPPLNIVVFDPRFFSSAPAELIRFVVAHELAHFSLGHHRKRWALVVSGLALFPWAQELFRTFEAEADAEASRRTGWIRSAFPELCPLEKTK